MSIDPSNLIGPHYTADIIDLETASLEDRIALFEDRVRGYFTTRARLLASMYENSVFLVLLVVSICVEWLESFHQGQTSKGKSKKFIMSGFRRIFNPSRPDSVPGEKFEAELDKILEELYYQIRSGVIHTGTTRSKVLITSQIRDPLKVDFNASTGQVERIGINPLLSLLSIELHLSEYCTSLRNRENGEIRQKFDQAWNALRAEE